MKVNPNMFRGYDLRGIADKDLTPEIVEHIGKAYGTYLKRHGIFDAVIGYDCRFTSESYAEAIIKGFNSVGVNTVNIGLNLVGTFYWSQYYLKIKGGAFITASHNPSEYNGFKFMIDYSENLIDDGMQELRRMVEEDDIEQGNAIGNNEKKDVREAYFKDILEKLPLNKKFKIVVDPSHSTAGAIVPDLLRQAGCEVIEKNCDIDPSFPLGTPDPTESIIANRVKNEVLESTADIGFSYDADGDRIGIVDNQGTIIWNDVLVALFAIDVLHKHPEAIIMYNTLCSKLVKETILKYGGQPFMWRTGHGFLKKKNQEVKAAFIGELSGHFFFSADFYNHDDGIYSTMRLLHYLSRTNQTLAEALSSLPNYKSSPEIKVGCADEIKVSLMKKVAQKLKQDFSNAEIIDDERAGDGVRLEMEDSMFVIRYSQNGPYITVKFEAQTENKYDELKDYIKKLLHSYEEMDWKYGVNVESLE